MLIEAYLVSGFAQKNFLGQKVISIKLPVRREAKNQALLLDRITKERIIHQTLSRAEEPEQSYEAFQCLILTLGVSLPTGNICAKILLS